ncbi:MAG: hypothetical protein EG823_03680 [Actinobacteria bacterium]|nr:hypothetical protein [Actinomycetota bacterium]
MSDTSRDLYRHERRTAVHDARCFYTAANDPRATGRERRLNHLYFEASMRVARRMRALLHEQDAPDDARPP